MMTKIQFESGTGIYFNAGVNYMTGENDDVSIYAEIAVPENTTEDFGYVTMKNAIITAADKAGIDISGFTFWYDGQEQHLAPDASAKASVYVEIDTDDDSVEMEL